MEHNATLKDIAKLFLKLGIIGFGGPAARDTGLGIASLTVGLSTTPVVT